MDKEPKIPSKANIVPREISEEMRKSYLDYAMSVIVSRALPDVRDGLKPVHRRILYSMYKLGLTHTSRFRKSATVVGEVLGKYHPHGDSSVYDAMVRLAQDFSTRYMLVQGQGNFGSIDGDSPAAMRYTEARMTKISDELLSDIEKDTVNFVPNYDESIKEPQVLPSALPNLLLNGTLGIAVGMATKIPPHNLGEVVDATVALIENPKSTVDDLTEYIKGPDFPTRGIIFNQKDIRHIYASGRGGVVLRGEAEITEIKSGSYQIVISSIPYQVNKSELIIKMADLVKEKKIEGIRDIRDESDKDGLRIAIDLKSGGYPQNVLNNLYKKTDLEITYHVNMLALVDGIKPQILSVKAILEYFIKHRQEVVERRTRFDLRRADERAHILEGLKKALDHIDAVIKTIRASSDKEKAHEALVKKFKLSVAQATAILEMRLQNLASLERQKIEDELEEKRKIVKDLKELLSDPKKILKVIKDELIRLKGKYADERKTKVVKGPAKSMSIEDLVAEEEAVLVLTHGGYVKRTDPKEYKVQHRGGKGVIDLNTKEEDFVTHLITASTHDDLLFFTNKGKVYQSKMYEIPEGKRATKGKSIMNFLSLGADENVTSVLPFPKSQKGKKLSLVMVTRSGIIKKVSAESFHDVRRSGLIAIKLASGDELGWAFLVEKDDDIIIATSNGLSIKFASSDVREMGRAAAGVKAIKMKKEDLLIGADIVKKDVKGATLLIMSKNGFGKKTKIKEYKTQKRGGSGIKTANVTGKTGSLMIAKVVTPEVQELIAISEKGQVIRTELSQVPSLGRSTQGVRIMKLKTGDSIASLTCL